MATIQMRDKADRPFCGNTSYIITPMSCRKATGYCSRKITIQYIDRERDTVQSIKKLPNFSSTEKVREIIHLGLALLPLHLHFFAEAPVLNWFTKTNLILPS